MPNNCSLFPVPYMSMQILSWFPLLFIGDLPFTLSISWINMYSFQFKFFPFFEVESSLFSFYFINFRNDVSKLNHFPKYNYTKKQNKFGFIFSTFQVKISKFT